MYENEILIFLLATIVLIFLIMYHQQLSILPAPRWLFAAYVIAWFAWLATNLEHVFWTHLFNILEHLGYLINAGLLLLWCWFSSRAREAK